MGVATLSQSCVLYIGNINLNWTKVEIKKNKATKGRKKGDKYREIKEETANFWQKGRRKERKNERRRM